MPATHQRSFLVVEPVVVSSTMLYQGAPHGCDRVKAGHLVKAGHFTRAVRSSMERPLVYLITCLLFETSGAVEHRDL